MAGEGRAFLDSNIWLYAFIESQDQRKHKAAKKLLLTCSPVLGTQVINEICFNLTRKKVSTEEEIRELVDSFFQNYEVIPFNRGIIEEASYLRGIHFFSFWDSLIVSSALHAKATVLYSEDMQDGLRVKERLQILNPLKTDFHWP
ncbi:MAG: PIN domain-containing protein [Desulfococcaceae bacterium]